MDNPIAREHELAVALLQLADDAAMPDTFWSEDSRIALAREVLDIPADGRYTHARIWTNPC